MILVLLVILVNIVIMVSFLILDIGFPADSVKFAEPTDFCKSCCESTGSEKSVDSDESDGSG